MPDDASGEPMQFVEFVRAHQDMVYSTAVRIVGNAQEAQDIAQDVFVQAYRRYRDLESNPGAFAWLRTAARNMSLNHLTRYRNRFVFLGVGEGEDDVAGAIDNGADERFLDGNTEELRDALLRLPATFRVPLVLYYYEGFEYSEIARSLRVSLAKVKTDLLRGRRRLREILNRMEMGYGQETAVGARVESA